MNFVSDALFNGKRVLGFDLAASTPDANRIQLFRWRLTEAGALEALFFAFDQEL
jgi:IS5 family transposase